jgi:hypothetical protein
MLILQKADKIHQIRHYILVFVVLVSPARSAVVIFPGRGSVLVKPILALSLRIDQAAACFLRTF